MAEIKKRRKTRMYEPWGYREENNYQSDENIIQEDLDKFFAGASYNKDDKKIHFTNKDGEDKGTIDVTEFSSSVIESTSYDPETKILTIKFTNGDVVEINLADLIDENEVGPGLQVNDGIISIKINESGEPYISVSDSGLKISGIDQAIAGSMDEEKARAEQVEADLQAAIEAEGQRAQDAESTLGAKIDQEIADREADVNAEETRAKNVEAALTQQITALNTELDSEKTLREAADVRLENLITAEKNRAEAAEEALQDAIDAEEARATSAETKLETALDLLNQKLGYKDNETLQKNGEHEVAFGSYNISNTSEDASGRTIFSIGNGTADDARSNAFEVRENGDIYMWVENDYMQINRLLAMLAHEVYDDDDNSNNG